MKQARIVPAIDLIEGKCVRLRQGNFDQQEVVGEDPVRVAQGFAESGLTRLHVVDLDGARMGRPQHLDTVRAIWSATGMCIDLSGGLRSPDDIDRALEHGAQQVVIGSAAVLAPDAVIDWIRRFGPQAVMLGLDLLDGEVRIKGWQEGSGLSINSVLERFTGSGLQRVMSTDIGKDGTLSGAAVDLYRGLCQEYPHLSFIASGGIASAADIRQVAATGVCEIIVGKALYAGTINLSDVREFIW